MTDLLGTEGDPRSYEDADLDAVERELAEVSAHIDAATHRQLTLIRVVDASGHWARQGALSCAHWLSWRIALDLGAARERVRVARALPSLPSIDAEFRRGALSYSKLRAMARVATPANEARLLEMARQSTASQLERLCRGLRKTNAGATQDEPLERWVMPRPQADGTVRITAQLLPDEAERVMEALRAIRAQMREEQRGASDAAPKPNLADALVHLADVALADAATSDGVRTHGEDRAQVVVHLAPDALGDGYEAQLEDGTRVSAEALRRVACSSGLLAVARGERGEVLDIGRKSRVIPPSLRRAVLLRDQHRCVFPGCTHERFLDLHHIEHWMNGGETKLDNLVALCTYHHGWVHEGGWRMERDEDGAPRFVAPERRPLPWMHRAPSLTDDPIAELRRVQADLQIDEETGLTSWDGSPMDLEACVSACCDAGEEGMSVAEWLALHGREVSMSARA